MNITQELVYFGIAIFGVVSAIWLRIEARIKAAEEAASLRALAAQAKAETVAADFAKYQTHVAEVYVSKQGLRETRDEIMTGLKDVSDNLHRINDRFDRFSDQQRLAVREPEK